MTKPNFTADGVKAKITELQKLPDDALKSQTRVMRSNLSTWMTGNFTLDDEQSKFLHGMDPKEIKSIGADLADCLDFHLSLTVTFGPKVPISSKFIKTHGDLLVRSVDPNGLIKVTGRYEVNIVYE